GPELAVRPLEQGGHFLAVLLEVQRNGARAGRRLDGQLPVSRDCSLRECGDGNEQRRQNEARTGHDSRLPEREIAERMRDVTTGSGSPGAPGATLRRRCPTVPRR